MSAGSLPVYSLPAYVDTRKVFLQQAEFAGCVDLNRMPRFRECLAGDEGRVQVQLNFKTIESDQRLISGNLNARVAVTCQRCLDALVIHLADDINLVLLSAEQPAKDLDAALDPWICTGHRLDLASLVEEQLMLCLPVVSYHRDRDCLEQLNFGGSPQAVEAAAESRESPFSVLKALKE